MSKVCNLVNFGWVNINFEEKVEKFTIENSMLLIFKFLKLLQRTSGSLESTVGSFRDFSFQIRSEK